MSHELRTPMNAIIGMTTSWPAASAIPPSRTSSRIASSQPLAATANDIPRPSKIDARTPDPGETVFTVGSLVSKPGKPDRRQTGRQGLRSRPNSLRAGKPRTRRPLRLQRFSSALVGNAISSPAGTVTLAVYALDRRARENISLHFFVTDTGIGDTRVAAKVFEPFRQADGSIAKIQRHRRIARHLPPPDPG